MMTKTMTRSLLALVALALALGACAQPADVVSNNISVAADNFEINRRIVFYNGITDSYMLVIEGYCSLGNTDTQYKRTVTCQTGPNEYKKHFLGLSDNVTYFAEQIDGSFENRYQYRVIFRPSTIIPDIEVDLP